MIQGINPFPFPGLFYIYVVVYNCCLGILKAMDKAETVDSNRQTDFLYEIGRLFNSVKKIDLLLDEVLSLFARDYPVVRGMINIHDKETNEIVADIGNQYRRGK